eukprot:MONOS_9376.1-p1 / transcript=MONOS_9376.1 / gene=MONOS_9376 / organism=Monocercomonoides_exilis_PA203 / gene_product=unspecified product / transcript_product=unspecified product / location=Mono_scaffold00385:10650-18554(-) / protein_length=2385 / sequence_SO=supercontig / SO=protein_coding / is_pseudo=false
MPQAEATDIYQCSMNDLFYFLIDPNDEIYLVLELVAIITDKYNRILREVGLGWTTVAISSASGIKDISACSQFSLLKYYFTKELNYGTPRAIMLCGDFSANSLFHSIDGSIVTMCLCTHSKLSRASNILPNYKIFDERNGSESPVGLISSHVQFMLHVLFQEEIAKNQPLVEQSFIAAGGEPSNGLATGISMRETAASYNFSDSSMTIKGKDISMSSDRRVSASPGSSTVMMTPYSRPSMSPKPPLPARPSSGSRARMSSSPGSAGMSGKMSASGKTIRPASAGRGQMKGQSTIKGGKQAPIAKKKKIGRDVIDRKRFYDTILKEEGLKEAIYKRQVLMDSLTKRKSKKKGKKKGKKKTVKLQQQTEDEFEEDDEDNSLNDPENYGDIVDEFGYGGKKRKESGMSNDGYDDEDEEEGESEDELEINDFEGKRVPPIGSESWVDKCFWDEEADFDGKKQKSRTDKGIEERGRIVSSNARRRLVKGYLATRGSVLHRPWLFGASLVEPLKQETISLRLGDLKFIVPTDDCGVSILQRKLYVMQHNGSRPVGEVIERDLVQGPTAQSPSGNRRYSLSVLQMNKSQKPIIIQAVYPHPKTVLLFFIVYELEMPLTTELDEKELAEKQKERGHGPLAKSKFPMPAKVNPMLWVGWSEFRPFSFVHARREEDDQLENEEEDEEVEEFENDGSQDEDYGFDDFLTEEMFMSGSIDGEEGSGMFGSPGQTIGEGATLSSMSGMSPLADPAVVAERRRQILERRMREMKKRMLMRCQHLLVPPKIAKEKKFRIPAPHDVKCRIRNTPAINIFFPDSGGRWIFDPTRGFSAQPMSGIGAQGLAVKRITDGSGSSSSGSGGGAGSGSGAGGGSSNVAGGGMGDGMSSALPCPTETELADSIAMPPLPPNRQLTAVKRPGAASNASGGGRGGLGGRSVTIEHEIVFPFNVLHPSSDPTYLSGPLDAPTAQTADDVQPLIQFKLYLVDEYYDRFPAYVLPTWTVRKQKSKKEPEPVKAETPLPETVTLGEQRSASIVAQPPSPQPTAGLSITAWKRRRLNEINDDGLCSMLKLRFEGFIRDGIMQMRQGGVKGSIPFPDRVSFSFKFFSLPRIWSEKGVAQTRLMDDRRRGSIGVGRMDSDFESGNSIRITNDTGKPLECSVVVDPHIMYNLPIIRTSSASSNLGLTETSTAGWKTSAGTLRQPNAPIGAHHAYSPSTASSSASSSSSSISASSTALMSSLLPYRLEGDVLPTTRNTSITLPDYLDSRSIQIEVFDTRKKMLFAVAYLSLRELASLMAMEIGKKDQTEGCLTKTIDLWAPSLSLFSHPSLSYTMDMASSMFPQTSTATAQPNSDSIPNVSFAVGSATPSPAAFSNASQQFAKSSGDYLTQPMVHPPPMEKHLGKLVVTASHSRVQHRFDRGKLMEWLRHQKIEREKEALAGAGSKEKKAMVVGGGKLKRYEEFWVGDRPKPLKEEEGKDPSVSDEYMRKSYAAMCEAERIREQHKQRDLNALFMHNSSTTRVIYPSFAAPVFFEIPLTNPQSEQIDVEVHIQRMPLKRAVEEALMRTRTSAAAISLVQTAAAKGQLGFGDDAFRSGEDGRRYDGKGTEEDELFVLNEEETFAYRKMFDLGASNEKESQIKDSNSASNIYGIQYQKEPLLSRETEMAMHGSIGRGNITSRTTLASGGLSELNGRSDFRDRGRNRRQSEIFSVEANQTKQLGFVFQSMCCGDCGVAMGMWQDGIVEDDGKGKGKGLKKKGKGMSLSDVVQNAQQTYLGLSEPKIQMSLNRKGKKNGEWDENNEDDDSNSDNEDSDTDDNQSDDDFDERNVEDIAKQPFVTLGTTQDPFGEPICVSPRIRPRIIEITVTEQKTRHTITKCHVLVLPSGHAVDKTVRVYAQEGKSADVRIILPPPFTSSGSFSSQASSPMTSVPSYKTDVDMNRGDRGVVSFSTAGNAGRSTRTVQFSQRPPQFKKAVLCKIPDHFGTSIEIRGQSDVISQSSFMSTAGSGLERDAVTMAMASSGSSRTASGIQSTSSATQLLARQILLLNCPSPSFFSFCSVKKNQQKQSGAEREDLSAQQQHMPSSFRPYRFELAVFDDDLCGSLFEVWEIIVYSVPSISVEVEMGEFTDILGKMGLEAMLIKEERERQRRRERDLMLEDGGAGKHRRSRIDNTGSDFDSKAAVCELIKEVMMTEHITSPSNYAAVIQELSPPPSPIDTSLDNSTALSPSDYSSFHPRVQVQPMYGIMTYLPGKRTSLANLIDTQSGIVRRSYLIHTSTNVESRKDKLRRFSTSIEIMHQEWIRMEFQNPYSITKEFRITTDSTGLFILPAMSIRLEGKQAIVLTLQIVTHFEEGAEEGSVFICGSDGSDDDGLEAWWKIRVKFVAERSEKCGVLIEEN